MSTKLRAPITLILLSALLLLNGCGLASRHEKAIESAIVAYSDYYIEVRDLGSQVDAQAKELDPDAASFEYTITALVPDYSTLTPETLPFTPPDVDYSEPNAAAYRQNALTSLRQTAEGYALEHTFSAYAEVPLTLVAEQDGDDWTASIASTSRQNVENTVESLLGSLLDSYDAYTENSRLAAIAESKTSLLGIVFGGGGYAESASVENVVPLGGGAYKVTLSFPDPKLVYGELAEDYYASFNQPFFGDEMTVSLSADDLSGVNTPVMETLSADVAISCDDSTGICSLTDASALSALIDPAKQQSEQTISARVNADWRVPAVEPPASGSVLEGESRGNEIKFVTSADLGAYYYVRFYLLTGEDVSEEGTLAAGLFIVGGKKASIRLPSGYYRITCMVGDAWYGLDFLFGAESKTYNGSNAVQSRAGYINTVSFG
ncbi:MAG TPA: hypothetical protein VN417_04340 [Candidatus Cryosericum sp.]|nr:hypothetical protein [Candidatus Cryosericum sp.]